MGSYGIGISRIPAAIIEASNDDNGIIWPKEVSPFDIILINLTSNNESTTSFCEELYARLKKNNYDVLFDDRSERPGIKFSDADLIGVPIQIIVGKNFVDKKEIGVKTRKDLKEHVITSDNLIDFLKNKSVMVTFFEIWVSLKYLLPKTKEKFFSIITIFLLLVSH